MNIDVVIDGHMYHYPNIPDHMAWPLIDALEEAGVNMDDAKHLIRARERIANLEAERDELRREMETAHEAIGQAIALLSQGHTDAGLSVLYGALRREA